MGVLMQICPIRGCKYWNSEDLKNCHKCGASLTKFSGKVWAIDYYDVNGDRKREKIDKSKKAAERCLNEVEIAVTDGKHIKKSPDAKTTFSELAQWYVELDKVKAKRSYERDKRSLKHIVHFFGNRLLKNITPSLVEGYQYKRLSESSYRGHLTKPATVNRELACLKSIFNKAILNDKAERNPTRGVKMLPENNERDRVLSLEEYNSLLAHCPPHIKPIVKLGYHTGMRQGEILGLVWGKIDFKEKRIKLRPEDTKTNEGRKVYLNREVIEMLQAMPRGLPEVHVFTRNGKPINSIREGFESTLKRAGIEDFTFHDLRHTYVTNKRREGFHDFVIMASTGHKNLKTHRRYNTVSDEELRDLAEGKKNQNGQYLDSDNI